MKTRITELLGIETPIICGGMMRVGTAELAAAASNAGALGVMTALTLPTPELLRAEIEKCRSLTNKPFGVNLTVGVVATAVNYDDYIDVILDCGVKTFEHSFFISEETMQKIAAVGGFVVPQMWGISPDLAKNPLMPPAKIPLVKELGKQYADFGRNLLKNGVKVVFASDYVGAFEDAERARRYEIWWRTQTFDSNFEVLKQMTSNAGEMLMLSGPRNPYGAGKQGVIEPGAYADLLLVDGNPLEDITVIGGQTEWFDADPEWEPIETLHLIRKDGVIYKNTL